MTLQDYINKAKAEFKTDLDSIFCRLNSDFKEADPNVPNALDALPYDLEPRTVELVFGDIIITIGLCGDAGTDYVNVFIDVYDDKNTELIGSAYKTYNGEDLDEIRAAIKTANMFYEVAKKFNTRLDGKAIESIAKKVNAEFYSDLEQM